MLGLVACIAAVVGLLTLTQATQGVGFIGLACLLAILARILQAEGHHTQGTRQRIIAEPRAGFIRPPAEGIWPPKTGEVLALSVPLDLRGTASREAPWTGSIPPRIRFTMLTVQGNWLYVQTVDGRTEGWAETEAPGAHATL